MLTMMTLKIYLVSLLIHFQNFDVTHAQQELQVLLDQYIDQKYQLFREDILVLKNALAEYQREGGYQLPKQVIEKYHAIKYGHELLQALERESEARADEYFRLWDAVVRKKKRVDNLFTFKEVVGSQVLMLQREVTSVEKRAIFQAYTLLYNRYLQQLKVTAECDYYMKIQTLRRMQPVLEVAEKLVYIHNTRSFEKILRNIDDPELLEKELLSYNFE